MRLGAKHPYLMVLLMAAAFSTAQSAASPTGSQDIVYNLPDEPLTLDPTYAYGTSSLTLAVNMFEGLLRLDNTHRPVPGMAQSWKISPDALVYRFTLREASWSDGQPVTAGDFVFSWLRALTPGQPAETTPLLFAVANAEAYHKGALLDPNQVGVKAIDARTLEVRLAHPAAHFLTMCCLPPFLPVNKRVVQANPSDWSVGAKVAVANGPFRLAGYQPHGHVLLTPNPRYWRRNAVRPASVTLTWLSPSEAEKAYSANLVDGMVNALPGLPGQFLVRPELRLTYLLFNLRKPPFAQLEARQAVAAALDRTGFVAQAETAEMPAFAVVPQGLPDAVVGKDFRASGGAMPLADRDLSAARQYLAVAGFPNGEGLPELELVYAGGTQRNEAFAAAVMSSLAEAGMKVTPVAVNWQEYQTRLASGSFALARVGWVADYPDPQSFLGLFVTGASTNFGGYQSNAYDQALQEAAAAVDGTSRVKALHLAESVLLGDLPLVPFSFGKRTYMERTRLHDVVHLAVGAPLFSFAWVAAN